MKKMIMFLVSLVLVSGVWAQEKVDKSVLNWYNKDLEADKVFGVSTEKTYKELLNGKQSKTVIVAIIDGGTDVNHEDLKGQIWVNPGEIAGNGIDDDKNGYIDDIHGWNFIGNAKGENVKQDNLEVTRLYRDLKAKYKYVEEANAEDKDEYLLYKRVKSDYLKKSAQTDDGDESQEFIKDIQSADSLVKAYLGKTKYTEKDLKKMKKAPANVQAAANKLKVWAMFGLSPSDIVAYSQQMGSEANYHYNLDFDPRYIVGDDYKDNTNRFYGNNDVTGPDPSHGTFVAGQVGAVRNNKIGADGIADNVKLMIIRVVPDGDERDKDVANGIRYAIENGAKVINMSFGKAYSPQKHFVDEVLPLADKYDVLLVHAAGNDAENNDEVENFPTCEGPDGKPLTQNWIEVGASSRTQGSDLVASFSNYGKKAVDVFAPGLQIYGLEPGSQYGTASGTSMASPVVAGVAAVIRSYFPQLTATEVRQAILQSVTKYDGQVLKPNEDGERSMVNFIELSVTGGVVNLYNAVKAAEEIAARKN